MLSNAPRKVIDSLTVKDLEELLELKRKNTQLSDLLKERERLRLELRHVEDSIETVEQHGNPPDAPFRHGDLETRMFDRILGPEPFGARRKG